MEISKFDITGPMIITPTLFTDERGLFFESFNTKKLSELGVKCNFVQDNVSRSEFGVLRGLHYQIEPKSQAKLITVLTGKILDVAVDIRKGSPTFGKYISVELFAEDHKIFFIPKGFAHGFVSLEEDTLVQYKCDDFYSPESERGINYLDPEININWKFEKEKIIITDRDNQFPNMNEADINFVYEG